MNDFLFRRRQKVTQRSSVIFTNTNNETPDYNSTDNKLSTQKITKKYKGFVFYCINPVINIHDISKNDCLILVIAYRFAHLQFSVLHGDNKFLISKGATAAI